MIKHKFIILILFLTAFGGCYAIAPGFSDYVNFANTSSQSATQKMAHFDPTQFKSYTSNPQQTQYYQKSDVDMNAAVPAALQKSNSGQVIENTISQDQSYTVNPKSPEIERSNIMETDAYDVTHGISDKYVQCHKHAHSDCHMTYYPAQCTKSLSEKLICYLTPNVTIKTVHYKKTIPYTGNIPSSYYVNTFTLPESGIITGFSITLHSGNKWRCYGPYQAYINRNNFGTYYPHCGHKLGILTFSNNNLSIAVQANQPIDFGISGDVDGMWSSAQYTVQLKVKAVKKTPIITMEDSCSNIPIICTASTSNCLIPGGTQTFDGIPVYQSCWRNQQNYTCGSTPDNSCNALLDKGCSESSSACIQTINNVCVSYQVNMSCPKQECVNNDIVCGTHSFCMDGNCYQPKSSQNQNFGKDEAQMAAVTGAADSVSNNQQSLQAFTGNGMNCSLAPIGFLNCCADHGWGKDIGLGKCTSEEKTLGKDRENGYAIYVGKYCSDRVLGVCITHKKSFCVFNGLLAEDVQNQGRRGQLNIGFGSAKTPDCSGLSVAQLQQINFSKIDFSNLESQLEKQAQYPNQSSVSEYIENKIKQEMGGS